MIKLKTLTQVIRLINENYVDEADMNDVLDGAIIGLLDKLDPHSSYLTSDLLEQMQENFQGEFEGKSMLVCVYLCIYIYTVYIYIYIYIYSPYMVSGIVLYVYVWSD